MSVDRERLFAKGGVENDIGCLPADARKFLQLLAGTRDITAVSVD